MQVIQPASEILGPLEIFTMNPLVNKSCSIEACGNKMYQIVAYDFVLKISDMDKVCCEGQLYQVSFLYFIYGSKKIPKYWTLTPIEM